LTYISSHLILVSAHNGDEPPKEVPITSLYSLYRRWPVCTVRNSPRVSCAHHSTELHSMYNLLSSNILYSSILYFWNWNIYQKLCDFLTVEWFRHVINCICILALTTLKMATWVAETCRLLLSNKVAFIHPSVCVGLIKVTVIWYCFLSLSLCLSLSLLRAVENGAEQFQLSSTNSFVSYNGSYSHPPLLRNDA